MEVTSPSLDKYFASDEKSYRRRDFVVKQLSKHKVGIALSSEVVDRLGLIAGLDVCTQELQGNTVILRFHRKGGFET